MSRAFEYGKLHEPIGANQRRLLCATDLSFRSECALQASAVLANRRAAQLTVVLDCNVLIGAAELPQPRIH